MRVLSGAVYYLESVFRLLTGFRNPFRIVVMFGARHDRGTTQVSLRKGPRFFVRGKMDIWTIKETFLDRFYNRYVGSVRDGWKIIDIGAGFGDFTILAAQSASGSFVHAYEPLDSSFDLLQRNLDLNGIRNVSIHKSAVSGKPERVRFRAGEDAGDALQTVSMPDDSPDATGAETLAAAMARIGVCDLLKLDCEGAEHRILSDSPDSIFSGISRIVMEYHDGEFGNHSQLVQRLSGLGYTVRSEPNRVHTHLGYIYAWRRDQ